MAGILLGLSHLDSSEVRLKSLTYKKGYVTEPQSPQLLVF